jgi:hypothetical protein
VKKAGLQPMFMGFIALRERRGFLQGSKKICWWRRKDPSSRETSTSNPRIIDLACRMAQKTGLDEFRTLLATGGLPELGPGPRAGVLPVAALDEALHLLLDSRKLAAGRRELIRALILLWHDHQDAAHVIAQEVENADGSFVHGIIHRREPDYGNATYWFRRVGAHPCFPMIATRVGELLAAKNHGVVQMELLRGGKWDPFAFIRLCEKASVKSKNDAQTDLLRQIQGIESEVLLEYLLSA